MRNYLLSIFLATFGGLFAEDGKVALLSFPCSGNTWSRYCIESIVKRPTTFYDFNSIQDPKMKLPNSPFGEIFDIDTDFSLPFVYKHHTTVGLTGEPIIMILRHPLECILSANGLYFSGQNIKDLEPSQKTILLDSFHSLVRNIKYFEELENKKLLIYYEDLLSFPEEQLRKISNFLSNGTDIEPALHDFMEQYTLHQQRIVDFYSNYSIKKVSTGSKKKLIFHRLKLSEKLRKHCLKELKEIDPAIWTKYLSRYEA